MAHSDPTVYIVVADDPALHSGVIAALAAAGHPVASFPSAGAFLAGAPPDAAGCLLVDVALPAGGGAALLDELRRRRWSLPIILTAAPELARLLRSVRGGGYECLSNPVDPAEVLATVSRVLRSDAATRAARAEQEALRARFLRLTTRERAVCESVAQGLLNRQIAAALGIKESTVKAHRAQVMEKLGVGSLPELVRLVDRIS